MLRSAWRERLDYGDALAEMEASRAAILAGDETASRLILCEHEPVITCGRRTQGENVLLSDVELARRGIARVDIERGGDVTYHGPGQLMIYPVVRVGLGVRHFLECIADTLAEVATSYGVFGARWRHDEPGLWLGDRKLAACGLHLSRGVCIHGFSFNVSTPAQDWGCIVPCGLSGPGPVSLAESMSGAMDAPSVRDFAAKLEPVLLQTLAPYGLGHSRSLEC